MTARDSRPPPHVAIRASAGSGKTFQLTIRYIDLLARGEHPERILATTFTRKAAGEILGRVMNALAKAAGSAAECRELSRHLERSLAQDAALGLLRRMLDSIHRLRISTLDSFFLRVAASFPFELGLPPGWRIHDETAAAGLVDEAIRRMLSSENRKDLEGILRLLSKGDVSRSVAGQVRTLVRDLHSVYLEASPAAWTAVPRPPRLSKERMDELRGALREHPLPADKRFARARGADLQRADDEDWEAFIGSGIAGAVLAGKETFYGKPLEPSLLEIYRKLLGQARAVILDRLARQTEATRDLLERFDARYVEVKRESRGFSFDDITRSLAERALLERLGDVYYRLDSQVAHLLLDEFQDTSMHQWTVLRPVAEEIVSHGDGSRRFLCVGDVKQAIYGWRGGVAEIFNSVEEQLPGVEPLSLATSWRSAPPVIDAINEVFGSLEENPAFPAGDLEAVRAWQKGFEVHTTAKADLAGHVRLTVAPGAAPEASAREAMLAFAAREIRRLHELAPQLSIGVLARTNKTIALLMPELRRLGVPASEEGKNPVTDSPPAAAIASLLEMADHPGSTADRFHVATSPLGAVVGLGPSSSSEEAARVASRIRRDLLRRGYGPTIQAWVEALAPRCDEPALRRLEQLVDLAYRYEDAATLRPGDFVTFMEETRVADPTRGEVRVMTMHQAKGLQFDVVVIPCFKEQLIGRTPPLVIHRESPTLPIGRVCRYANRDVLLLAPALRPLFDAHRAQSIRESLSVLYVAVTRARHALHLIVAPPPASARKKEPPLTFAGVLRGALAPDAALEPESVIYEKGDPRWHEKELRRRAKAAEEVDETKTPSARAERRAPQPALEEPRIRIARSDAERRRGRPRTSPSQMEGGERVKLAERLRLSPEAARRGTLVHAWLESIEWIEDGEPADGELLEIARRLGTDETLAHELLPSLRAMLCAPAVRECLSRDAALAAARRLVAAAREGDTARAGNAGPAGSAARETGAAQERGAARESGAGEEVSVRVARELQFALLESDQVMTGAIDRLVLVEAGGCPIAAEVIDFKTDAAAADDERRLDQLESFYHPQIAAYRRAAARIAGLPASAVSARLLFVAAGVSRRVRR